MENNYLKYNFDNNVIAITSLKDAKNMAYQVTNNKEEVYQNRISLFKEIGIDYNNCCYVYQFHSDILLKVNQDDKGKGKDSFESGLRCDALYTFENNIPLVIFHADCQPILLYSKQDQFIAIIHAGYEGTLKHITSKVIKQISSLINIKNLKISFGPSASYFPLKNEDVNRLDDYQKDCIINNDNCLYLDIRKANLSQLLTNNIKKEQIDFTNMFDTLKSDFTFSASKDKIQNRMISLIMLKQ